MRGKSDKTVDEYFSDLRTFFRYLLFKNGVVDEENFDNADISLVTADMLNSLTLNDLYAFLVYCKKTSGLMRLLPEPENARL